MQNLTEQKVFTKYNRKQNPLPNLISLQLESYQWFWDVGLRELFDEVSPIRDFSGKDLELYFLDYTLEEPRWNENEARLHNASFESTLRVKLRLVNKKTGEVKEQSAYLGEFPLMTPRGTFIVNGVERVVISQLIRSPGVFFTLQQTRGWRLFGSKIIPNRGAWLEFDTDLNGVIGVKIDRKRRAPVSVLLRAFGLETNEEIKAKFKNVDIGPIKYIDETLKRDLSKNKGEALLEIYKRIRPGDLATIDNARQLIEAMFFNFDRYDLSSVGRWKMEERLTGEGPKVISKAIRVLSVDDIVRIVSEIIKMNNDPQAKPDEIDHLGNRRIRAFGELLQNRLRIGLVRMERIIKDRMSTLDIYTLTPVQLLNSRPLMAIVREFFTSSQLSQFMDNENPLAELEHKRRLSAMGPGGLTRERAGLDVRDVQPSHYGRICPIESPEGPNIGLVGHLASFARLNPYGFIETPYVKVLKNKVTDEIIWLDASQEQKYVIAHGGVEIDNNGKIKDERVEARVHGEPSQVHRGEVQLIDVAPQQAVSIATALIPFLEHDDATRAMMGSNMQRQAVPCIVPDPPLVGTGFESRTAVDSGQVIIAEEDGIVNSVDASHITIQQKGKAGKAGQKAYDLKVFMRSNQYTAITQKPRVDVGQRIKKGDVLSDGPAISNGELALGQNLLVAFLPWRGSNYEDAIVISERVVQQDRFTSAHIEDFICDVRDTKLGPEITTPDIPNVGEDRLRNLDEEGIVHIGAEVGPGDILVGKISPKGEADLTAEERLLRAIFGEKARDVKDTSLRLPHGKRGRIVGIRVFSREQGDKLPPGVIRSVQVEVAQLRKASIGDKLAGRHGNKGVISKILPVEDMPFLEDGTPVDIVLNPLGVLSRMNIGQILETHLGMAAHKLGFYAKTPALAGATEDDIRRELKKAGLPESGKLKLFDGYTGQAFPKPVTVGYIYMMKLIHMVEDKIHMRSIGPYSLITQQPLGGKAQFGGQRFGEMEVWALEGYGSSHTLQEMLTIKSDDVLGRSAAYESIIRNQSIKSPNIPASFNVLVAELKALGLGVELLGVQLAPPEEQEGK
ncbi:MAG: DNA-directed RNA polymerase subunit beta [Parcubacteria group bacterium GW2011_GWA2_40_8]|nr:MAG: DNA-directed RNA polymerase subunit beta [Parcubacteria group bacterium GW2011_GWB1_40_14]KKR79088.1 MAG: DNA-directed RNA polymerase subunit beta [Parcubacteria group bacterium GW2011_GWA2_40_8]